MRNKGLLIVNLGSPVSSEVKDVKPFLTEFLMDKEVMDVPWLIRFPLVHGLIVPRRAENSAKAYQTIFTKKGSPLRFYTEDFIEQIKASLSSSYGQIDFAMRYGDPSIESRIGEFVERGVSELTVIPMYPQFAKSSTRTVLKEIYRAAMKHKSSLRVKVLRDFYNDKAYVNSFVHIIQAEAKNFKPDHLLLSYHGLPESHVMEFGQNACFKTLSCCEKITKENQLCYRAQCFASSRAIISSLAPEFGVSISFQSRLGKQEWIKPYTDKEISNLFDKGVRRLLVACPAFVTDCLETLEEIAIRLREDFISLGGEDLRLVPSLNAHPYWTKAFSEMISEKEPCLNDLSQVLEEVK